MFKRALTHAKMRNLAQRRVSVPYSVEVASQALQKATMPNLLLYILVGERFTVFKENKIVSKHVTKQRLIYVQKIALNNFFAFDDINLAMYEYI